VRAKNGYEFDNSTSLKRLCEQIHPCFVVDFVFVFALTMAGDDKRDDQSQATKTKLDTIVSHLEAMKTLITSLQKEMDAGDFSGRTRRA
jgi:hypothetical protein